MSGLTGKAIKDTYKSLLKINDDGLITEVFKNVTDGENNSSGLYLKREGIYVSGSFESDNITGSLQGTSSYAVTASYALNNAGGGGGGENDDFMLVNTFRSMFNY